MNKGCKIVFIIFTVLLVILGIAAAVGLRYVKKILTSDAGRVSEIAHSIVNMTLPDCYQESFGSSFKSLHQVMYTCGDATNQVALSLIEITGKQALQPEAVAKLGRAPINGIDSQFVAESRTQEMGQIRGQTTRFTRTEGHHQSLGDIRILSVIFDTRDGLAKLTIVCPVSRWNDEEFSTIIKSIK